MALQPVDARSRFSPVAEVYHLGRPAYPEPLVDWIVSAVGLRPKATVVDIGCGTGIATRLFAARGFDVLGIDSSAAMLAEARRVGGARYLLGEAAATGLPAATAALVTVAQALHWFDLEAVLPEFQRLLRPAGWVAVFWNERRPTAFAQAYDELLTRSSTEFTGARRAAKVIAALRARPAVRDCVERNFEYRQTLDRELLLARARSSSYVAHGVADLARFESELNALFDAHQRRRQVVFDYDTSALIFRLGSCPPASR